MSEAELPLVIDGNQVKVRMRNLEACNNHTDSLRGKVSHLRFRYSLRHRHEMSVQFGIEVDPMGNLLHRNN